MDFERIKRIARGLGVYRQARWFNRHFHNRNELFVERMDLEFYSKLLRRDGLVFDVGASYGEKSRIFLRLGANVVAFEPQTDCRQELQARFGAVPNLTVLDSALGSQSGYATFYVRQSRAQSGLVRNWGNAPEIEQELEVPVVTLDDAIEKYGNPMYVKIDVEGYEYEVLKGLSRPVSCVSFEFHLTDGHRQRNHEDIQKTVNCIEHLGSLADISLNITPAERLVFGFDEWLPKDAFLDFFTNLDVDKFKTLFSFVQRPKSYGDIFREDTSVMQVFAMCAQSRPLEGIEHALPDELSRSAAFRGCNGS